MLTFISLPGFKPHLPVPFQSQSYLIIKTTILIVTALAAFVLSRSASATQAGQTTITLTGQAAGPTPFISKLSLTSSNAAVLKAITLTVAPRPGTHARPISATYSKTYLNSRGYFNSETGRITVPVFGLYAGYTNTVALTYRFIDGSSKRGSATVPTEPFNDACEFNSAIVRQARTPGADLSYDFILIGSSCGLHSPTVIDTDGKVRWVGPAGVQNYTSYFFDNALYLADGPRLLRFELDGEVSVVRDYTTAGVLDLHHNIDRGKFGLIIDVNTEQFVEAVNLEVDPFSGEILRTWNLGEIIRSAMIAEGDDPSGFVREARGRYDFDAFEDWFHNNSATYRRYDNSLILSSRENFVIALDYDTKAIKWILGDATKKWYRYASLRNLALTVTSDGLAPVGQHSVSMAKDGTLLLMDNGQPSQHQFPAGPRRYSAPRKYKFDLPNRAVTESWSYLNGRNVFASYCSSIYEDARSNYLIDYANVAGKARVLGLNASGEKVFEYSYPTAKCEDAYRSLPIHWEKLAFSTPVKAQLAAAADDEAP